MGCASSVPTASNEPAVKIPTPEISRGKIPVLIRALHSDLYLEYEGGNLEKGTSVIQNPKMSVKESQQWVLNDDHTISPVGHPELAWMTIGNPYPGNKVSLAPKVDKETDSDGFFCQMWKVEGEYIVNQSGTNLDISDASTESGANIIVDQLRPGPRQWFHFEPAHVEQGFLIKCAHSGLYLTCEDGKFTPGTRVIQSAKTRKNAGQLWMCNRDCTMSPIGHDNLALGCDTFNFAGRGLIIKETLGESWQNIVTYENGRLSWANGLIAGVSEHSTADGAPLIAYQRDGNPESGHFVIETPKGEQPAFRINPFAVTGRYLEIDGEIAAGVGIKLRGSDDNGKQEWQWNEDGTISPWKHPELVLDVEGDSEDDRVILKEKASDAPHSQKWRHERWQLCNESGLAMDMDNAESGGSVIVKQPIQSLHQRFSIEPVPSE